MAFNDVLMILILELVWQPGLVIEPAVTSDGFVAYNYCECS